MRYLSTLRTKRTAAPTLPLAALHLILAVSACDDSRERPTGAGDPVPPTRVSVVSPVTDDLVPSDSVADVLVEASGSLQALEFFVARVALPDTLSRERLTFDPPREQVETTFEVRIPPLQTGVHLEIRAVAEDVLGDRHLSPPVFVMVIECDVFPHACSGP